MKLLHTVVRFCVAHARDVSGRGATTVPRDLRVTVPAPLNQAHGTGVGIIADRPAMALRAAGQH